jgi:MFS family permease
VFLFLVTPYGMVTGYVTVVLAYLLSKAGASVGQIASLVAISFLPSVWGFGWAHLVDTTLTRKGWYLIGALSSGVGILAMGIVPIHAANLTLLSLVALAAAIGATFISNAAGGLMACGISPECKGRAAGWYQAGNFVGMGVGGGLGLWLTQHLPQPWMSGALLCGVCLMCCIGLRFLPEPESTVRTSTYIGTMSNVFRDIWGVAKSRLGFLALFLCLLPIGSGAAGYLWAAVAGDWHASAATVALVTGILGGMLSAGGCLLGGWICDRMDRKSAYIMYGLLQAGCALGMALAPRTEPMYVLWTSAYAVISGLTYAGFTAFVLEAMGTGAAATKYNAFVSLSNAPITCMIMLNGWAHSHWGARGMLTAEAAMGVIGMLLFLVVTVLVNTMRPVLEPVLIVESE